MFKFQRFIKNEVALKHIEKIFSEKNIKLNKDVHDKKDYFVECINSDEININHKDADELIRNSIKYGSRRFLYITNFNNTTKSKLRNPEFILTALKNIDPNINNLNGINTLNSEETNTIASIDFNTDYIEYLETTMDESNKVSSINLCITNFEKKVDDDLTSYIKNYYWIEFLIDKKLLFSEFPHQHLFLGRMLTQIKLFPNITS